MNEVRYSKLMAAAIKEHRDGRLSEASATYRKILSFRPADGNAMHLLGLVASHSGQPDEAIRLIQDAIRIFPKAANFHNSLGNVLRDAGQVPAAIIAFKQAIELQPGFAGAHNNLGVAYKVIGEMDAAERCFRKAFALQSDFTDALSNLGTTLAEQARIVDGISCIRDALALSPADARLANVYNYLIQFDPSFTAGQIGAAAKAFGESLQAAPMTAAFAERKRSRQRIRVGYVSPDFVDHVVGRNVLPLFEHHDRNRFEVHAFANNRTSDDFTARFKRLADGWHDITADSDASLKQKVSQAQIDILVDLSLHMPGNRLTAFASRMAPIQVTFAGYPGTTGVQAMDYRLSDVFLDPTDQDEDAYSEKTIRLPDSFWCYSADNLVPEVGPPPLEQNGCVTFGCLNSAMKLNGPLFELWSQLMRRLPDTKLALLARAGGIREMIMQRMVQLGVNADRLIFLPPTDRRSYLRYYQQIDIALDSVPYNGHTTSLDTMYSGVPLITLVGQTIAGCAGRSQLNNLGLQDLIATTPQAYIDVAADLAANTLRLWSLRAGLRGRMESSPLMDARRFTENVEQAFMGMLTEHNLI